MQQEAVALASSNTSPPRGRTTTREAQNLCNVLAKMFGLPPIHIPQSPVDQSASPMAAISTSQSHRNKLCRSPPVSSIPATRCYSPEPEAGPSKQPITWDLKVLCLVYCFLVLRHRLSVISVAEQCPACPSVVWTYC